MSELTPFEFPGAEVRFGLTQDGEPYAVAPEFARTMGYRDASNALRLLDEDEKGTQIVSTPGGDQRVSVIYEGGMWELIFRSSRPEAKAIKKKVKEILREIRRTGRYEAVTAPQPEPKPSQILVGPGRDRDEVWAWLRDGKDVRFLHAMSSTDIQRAA